MKIRILFYLLIVFLASVIDGYSQVNKALATPEIVKLIESTPLKNQYYTGTCWSFATTSFIESEAIRLGKKAVVLSPMFYVIPTYIDKAEKYIRMRGHSYFDEGDLTFNVMKAYKKYGAIPEEVYSGKINNATMHNHLTMNHDLLKKVKFYVDSGMGKMTAEGYRKDIENILIKTMGKVPEKFVYQGKEYTPKSFANEMIGINPDNYLEITSFTHHPFYSKVILETEANWDNNYYLNLPIDDFIKVVDSALQNNYSLGWDGDVSDPGFKNNYAILSGEYQNQKEITQQMRQYAFDNYTTKDDHNMHIIGQAKNENGDRYYVIKNSNHWNGTQFTYMSKEYLLLRTISILVHKEAIPKEIKEKCLSIN